MPILEVSILFFNFVKTLRVSTPRPIFGINHLRSGTKKNKAI